MARSPMLERGMEILGRLERADRVLRMVELVRCLLLAFVVLMLEVNWYVRASNTSAILALAFMLFNTCCAWYDDRERLKRTHFIEQMRADVDGIREEVALLDYLERKSSGRR